jgi:prophage regulatory protein
MKILRARQVTSTTGLSRTTLWRLERRGDFPRRVRLGPNSTGWIESEIQEWIKSRPRGMSISDNE